MFNRILMELNRLDVTSSDSKLFVFSKDPFRALSIEGTGATEVKKNASLNAILHWLSCPDPGPPEPPNQSVPNRTLH